MNFSLNMLFTRLFPRNDPHINPWLPAWLSCMHDKFRCLMSYVQLSFQSPTVNVLRWMEPMGHGGVRVDFILSCLVLWKINFCEIALINVKLPSNFFIHCCLNILTHSPNTCFSVEGYLFNWRCHTFFVVTCHWRCPYLLCRHLSLAMSLPFLSSLFILYSRRNLRPEQTAPTNWHSLSCQPTCWPT